MMGFGAIQQWNSRSFNLNEEEELEKFQELRETLQDFDFTWKKLLYLYSESNFANIHVQLRSNKTMEIWLIKHGFERAA